MLISHCHEDPRRLFHYPPAELWVRPDERLGWSHSTGWRDVSRRYRSDGFRALPTALDAYETVISRREKAMLEFLAEPRTLDEMIAHRFVYRPHVTLLFADAVERRSAELHLERPLRRGLVTQSAPDGYVVSPTS